MRFQDIQGKIFTQLNTDDIFLVHEMEAGLRFVQGNQNKHKKMNKSQTILAE